MKILHYVDENRLAWSETWIGLIKELGRLGMDNHVVCKGGGTLGDKLTEEKLSYDTFNIPISWMPQTGIKLRRIISELSPDIIHTRLSSAARIGGFWAKKTGIPVIETVDKYPKAHYHNNADHLIACSESAKKHMIGLGFPVSKISTVYNPVDPQKYLFDKDKALNARKKLGISPDEKIVLGAGRFVDRKGFDILIKAFNSFLKNNHQGNARLMLLGDGEEKDNLCKLVKTLGIEGRVIMPGFMEDIRPYMWASDIFVFPSKIPEPFGIVLIEAMASGLASIATKSGGPMEIIEDGVNGYLVEIDSCNAISEKISFLLNDDEIKNRISQNGIETVSKKFNIQDIAMKHMEIYRKFKIASK